MSRLKFAHFFIYQIELLRNGDKEETVIFGKKRKVNSQFYGNNKIRFYLRTCLTLT